ncbi:hypothetical protein L249_4959 [Ophiocordyceps polyrhachis-furcata BCC 54312]|uniref:CSC1/OSCA1-like 7TM region domain-containing protein n=1 Tax=Ophiocordyceps polyrhachis-furcata BCC 54312 TaxID=1330021 RepID=A0A367L3P9_9HYPO|nr:hypothetical protein L249_4959 [Ophiocordyceps polyrhachis-furcata BCC 54312]
MESNALIDNCFIAMDRRVPHAARYRDEMDNTPPGSIDSSTAQKPSGTDPSSIRDAVSALVFAASMSLETASKTLCSKIIPGLASTETGNGENDNPPPRLRERSIELETSWFTWLCTLSKLPDAYALPRQGLDSYLFLRFLRISSIICLTSILISWPVLFAVNVTGMGDERQLESLTYSNIDISKSPTRLYAHCFVGWAVFSFVIYTIVRECFFYAQLRQAYLVSPRYASRISSRTVLFASISTHLLDEAKLGLIFQEPIRRIHFLRKTDKLDLLVKNRHKAAIQLEKAEVDVIKARSKPSPDSGTPTVASRRSELQRLVVETERAQTQWSQGKTDLVGAVFVEFSTQAGAEEAYRAVNHHLGRRCVKAIGAKPSEIIWKNLAFSSWERFTRKCIVYGFFTAFVITWAFLIVAIGFIGKADKLRTLPGMAWINNLSKVSFTLIIAFVPPILMIIVMWPVPLLMGLFVRLAGIPSLCQAELFTQNACFVFQLTQVLIVQTIAATILPTMTPLAQGASTLLPSLRKTLPTASNFYISYFLLELVLAFVIFTLGIAPFLVRLHYKYFAKTPRAMFESWTFLPHRSFGSLLPTLATTVCISEMMPISAAYVRAKNNPIAPLVLGPSTLLLATLYFACRYDIFFISGGAVDTQGLLYPQALKHLFAGVYVAEVCLLGLFAISKAAGLTILMAVFLISTAVFQVAIFRRLDRLLYRFPVEMEGKSLSSTGDDIFKLFKHRVDAELAPLLTIIAADEPIAYTSKVEAEAYLPPCVTSKTPTLWIPADSAGISKQAVEMTGKMVPITDDGATIDDKNRISWDTEGALISSPFTTTTTTTAPPTTTTRNSILPPKLHTTMPTTAKTLPPRLADKTILITGASSGIGRATALEFARATPPHNLRLVLAARRIDSLHALARQMDQEFGTRVRVHPAQLDVSDADAVRRFVASLPEDMRDIHVLVNNASVFLLYFHHGPLGNNNIFFNFFISGLVKGVAKSPDIKEEDINIVLSTNLTGLINMTQAILPIYLARGGHGDIINIGSVAGRDAYPGGSIYCASKAAVRSYTESLRKELISTRIRVIQIDPGQVETVCSRNARLTRYPPLIHVLQEFSLVRFDGDKAKADAVYAGCEPLTPQDVAETIVFAAGRRENVVIAESLLFPNHQVRPSIPESEWLMAQSLVKGFRSTRTPKYITFHLPLLQRDGMHLNDLIFTPPPSAVPSMYVHPNSGTATHCRHRHCSIADRMRGLLISINFFLPGESVMPEAKSFR